MIKCVKWPHAMLALQYASKDIKYEELDMSVFIAGILETLLVDLKRKGCTRVTDKIRNLKSLMYNATQLD